MYYYKKKNMYIFDKEEKQEAHTTSVTDYLSRNYGLSFKSNGRGYRCKEHNSLYVNKNDMSWYWNSQAVGGGDVVAFVQKFDDRLDLRSVELDYADALKIILQPITSENRTTPTYKSKYKKVVSKVSDEKPELALPKAKEGRYNRVFAYLIQTRKIDKDIVSCLVHHKYIYEDTRGNVVFLGKDKNKEIKYATIRGTLTDKQFRLDCEGSEKENSFYLNGYDKSTLYVFEAPIDLLSHATLDNMISGNNKAWLNSCRLSLAGLSDNALEHYLSEYPQIRNIVFCLDNDERAVIATEKHINKYIEKGYNCSTSPAPKGKDYNEYLQIVKNQQNLKNAIS